MGNEVIDSKCKKHCTYLEPKRPLFVVLIGKGPFFGGFKFRPQNRGTNWFHVSMQYVFWGVIGSEAMPIREFFF